MFFNNRISLLNHGIKGQMQKTSTLSLMRRKDCETKWINQTKKCCQIRAFFVYSDQRSSSLFGTILSFEDKYLFFFSLFQFSLLFKTKPAAYLVYAVRVTL
ncbi:hypothetical protein AMECASPLE_002034 [Ameca splendens]|uniref:Uncharacterized protein n=1 Tax=Ameca splendens TaxID=208324 RepID=A0ABV0Y9C0_9TELE